MTNEQSTQDQASSDRKDAAPSKPHHPESFADLGVDARVVQALTEAGITTPFPIQAATIPVACGGHDVIGQAKTGTGKTLGFGLPIVQQVQGPGDPGFAERPGSGAPQALVVTPTRELAVQVANDLQTALKYRSARVLTVYGGRAYEPQIDALKAGVEIVVGTPGRLLDLANKQHLSLAHARIAVLDEADEMLDLGFLGDVEKLLSLLPDGRQTMLFSATMPAPVVALARQYMVQPTHIRATDPDDDGATVKAITQFVYRAHSLDKVEMLARILQARERGLTMVFTRTKRTADKVVQELTERGFAAAAIHGDLGQGAREQALRAFRSGKVDVLVATDVAARGIDVDDVTHVVNYQCPDDEKTYLHRIGRTGRAGNSGTAITLVNWDELTKWSLINQALDLGYGEPVETYSSSPHLSSDLNIPEGVTGRLPRAKRTRAGLGAEELEDLGGASSGQRVGETVAGKSRRRKRPTTAADGNGGVEWTRPQRTRSRKSAGAVGSSGHGEAGVGADRGAPEATAGDNAATQRPRRRRRRTKRPASPTEQP